MRKTQHGGWLTPDSLADGLSDSRGWVDEDVLHSVVLTLNQPAPGLPSWGKYRVTYTRTDRATRRPIRQRVSYHDTLDAARQAFSTHLKERP